jgi:enoyl-CoA hydratase/long-chain 3-hydroxyacyl-CoA dehydrogenase
MLSRALLRRGAHAGARALSSHAGQPVGSSGIFTLEVRSDGVAVIRMDDPSSKVNTLSRAFMDDVGPLVDQVNADPAVKSIVLMSSKPGCFIAGADIAMLNAMKTEAEVVEMCRGGHAIMDKLEKGKPTVAAIDGSCLGGGLEVALACTYRIASTSKKTKLGVPESQLGLLPGGGGTQRLPKLVGIQESLTMMTTGANRVPKVALKKGLVDGTADPFALEKAAIEAARGLAAGSVKPKRKKKALPNRVLEDTPFGRKILFQKAREMMVKKSGGHYPALFEIMDLVEKGAASGFREFDAEAEAFARLCMSPEAASLMSIFFGMTALKKNRYGSPKVKAGTVGILGAGLMGAGIAEVSVTKGMRVLLKDMNAGGLARGVAQIDGSLAKKVKKRKMSKFDKDRTMSGVVGISTEDMPGWGRHFKGADLVIEAVFEDLGVKHAVIEDCEQHIPEHAVFATNTSAIPIADIARASKRPERVLGMHYFSPVPSMPLLEIIPHAGTSDDAAALAVDVGTRQGKTVIVVKDVPGFYVNRSLGPYMAETTALLLDGVEPERLDKAIKKFGFPMGPCTLADMVGMDVAAHVQQFLGKAEGVGARMADGSGGTPGEGGALDTFVDKKMLGQKSGKGFYTYDKKGKAQGVNAEATAIITAARRKASKPTLDVSEQEIQERMWGRFVNEAVHCLQDGIVANPTDGDIGLIFGTGFPPFRGGPFRHLDAFGAQKFVDMMNGYADKYGEHFRPAPYVVDLAKKGGKFHAK